MLTIGDEVIMNGRCHVAEKNRGVIFTVLSEPWKSGSTYFVRLSDYDGVYAVDGLARVGVSKMEKSCIICGKLFVARNSLSLCCSNPCREARAKQLAQKRKEENPVVRIFEPRICPECGKEFVPTIGSRKYCSDKCRSAVSSRNSKRRKEDQRKAIAQEVEKLKKLREEQSHSCQKKKRRGLSDLSLYSKAAQDQGKSYGQLQAEEYAKQHRIVRKW